MSEVGMLNIKLVEAKDLPNEDATGKSDPFVIIQVGNDYHWSKAYKSKTIDNNNAPVWNETFDIPVKEPEKDSVRFTLVDDDVLGSDDHLGIVTVELKTLPKGQAKDCWLGLKLKGKDRGAVHVVLTATGFGC
mmetsp:Transcript_20798/g.23141  ORF Transcript_20798/g.23141 Transcript_20798/m.23141 type:complete len:133 (-) Transcript_20798:170-568(-)